MRISPPEQLDPPAPWLRAPLRILWIACLALAIFSQAGASWRVYVGHTVIGPTFASLGLSVTDEEMASYWGVAPASAAARRAGAIAGYIEEIGDDTLTGDEPSEEIARRLQGPDGSSVDLYIVGWEAGDADVTLTRSAENRAEVYAASNRNFMIASQFIDVAVALFIMAVAFLLLRRRPDEPVTILLSFMLLFMGTVGSQLIWQWLGQPLMPYVFEAIWVTLLIMAAPAFPTGRYKPAAMRWLLWAAPAAAVGLIVALFAANASYDADTGMEGAWTAMLATISEAFRMTILLAALLCVILRFRFTPRGMERQQMKWVTLGLGAGLLLYAVGVTYEDFGYLLTVPQGVQTALWMTAYGLQRLAFVLIALGLLASLLNFRLNDADAALGHSTGYAVITAIIGVVWAVATMWINKGITALTGSGNPALATSISTVVALAVLAPARTRVMSWTEKKFQRALVLLRSLPKALARWQHGGDPELVAERALAAIVKGVNAQGAALVAGAEEDGGLILALHEVEPALVEAQLGERRPADADEDRFPMRVAVADEFGTVATLLLGPRSDGASFSRDERAAILSVREPLADALRAASRRAELAGSIGEIRSRLEEFEKRAKRRKASARPANAA